MKQFFSILFTIAALFTFSSLVWAQDVRSAAKKVETVQWGKTRPGSHHKTFAVQKRIVTSPKPMLMPTVAAKPKPAKRTTGGIKVVYIKTVTPWYTNLLILWVAGGILLLVGGFIGRILSFGPIPRQEEAEEEKLAEQESWLKRFLHQFKKPEPSAI